MNCYYHTSRTANGQCKVCGKALCTECFNKGGGVCPECALEQIVKDRWRIKKKLIFFGVVVFVIAGLLAIGGTAPFFYSAIPVAYFLSSSMYGYDITKKLIPRNLVVLSIRSAIFYKMLTALLALLIGWVIAPWRILVSIRELITLRQKEHSVLF
jgi:hypothetical protein